MGEAVNCVMKDGTQTFGGDQSVVLTDVKLQLCTPDIYIMLYTNFHSVNITYLEIKQNF